MKNPFPLIVLGALLLACPKESPRTPPDAAIVGAAPQPAAPADADGGTAPSEEACLDAWLKARNLDPYGHPEGTVYAGGTPLFDEKTGETKDRRSYVYARQPEAQKACAPAR